MVRGSDNIADRLLQSGLIDKSQHKTAVDFARTHGAQIEDALIETTVISEDDLLKYLAKLYKTRFVSTSKLQKAEIGSHILKRISLKAAQQYNVFPILLDLKNNIMSIVASNPSDLNMEQDIKTAAGVTNVRSFVARPAAIRAAISKFYKGDIHAFTSIDKNSMLAYQSMMDVYERNLLDENSMVAAVASSNASSRERTISESEMKTRDKRANFQGENTNAKGLPIELMKIMVSLVESNRPELSSHSVFTANHVAKMCSRIGLTKWEANAITMAALIHDIGKGEPYHLTPFNVAEWEGHRTTALKRFETPARLFESAMLPIETNNAVRHMYERIDGKGFPDGLVGSQIPLGSRIIAIADTFSDLTQNPRNPYRRALSTTEAMEVLNKGEQKVFDTNLVKLFGTIVTGDDIKQKLLSNAQTLMLVDSDPEQCAILEMQMMAKGFKTKKCQSADDALISILKSPVDLILSEVDLLPYDGFELKKRLNEDEKTKNIPFVFFSSRSAAKDVENGFDLGAQDYLLKPSTSNVLATKIQKILDTNVSNTVQSGVSGSLKEMSIPDLVQIISHGQKTGLLKLRATREKGEIHFVKGNIYNALYKNLRGEEAFFAMLRLKDGTFSLDPNYVAEARVINMTSEMLLLEGLRRYDEGNR